MSFLTRRQFRATGAALVGLGLVVASASVASAHVHVTPQSTAAGGYSVLTFRVPTEKPDASTTRVVVDLPTDTPFTYAAVRPLPGWDAKVEEGKLPKSVDVEGATITKAPLHVTFTADKDSAVQPGQFQEFEIQVGPLPAEGTDLVLPAHQTYSDGTVVDWDEPSTGAEEPENPAPEFVVTAAEPEGGATPSAEPTSGATVSASPTAAAPTATAAAASSDAAPSSAASSNDEPDSLARWLGGLGLLAGVAALVVAVVTSRRGRSQA
ncbi:YcnI family protein [Cellulomonas sp. JH27-2]|uniref:YcnI family copper-binding membrane protein n=1 Tax=Cellulomonas sp. JH27-2 TaxID=2774139 RepID=UPI00177C7231|nr:YcnI family protein [Cellulomonas sp. JH27-2]MBD8058097.1 YcnI family protein [Cellulomonas sp. JH27-2]